MASIHFTASAAQHPPRMTHRTHCQEEDKIIKIALSILVGLANFSLLPLLPAGLLTILTTYLIFQIPFSSKGSRCSSAMPRNQSPPSAVFVHTTSPLSRPPTVFVHTTSPVDNTGIPSLRGEREPVGRGHRRTGSNARTPGKGFIILPLQSPTPDRASPPPTPRRHPHSTPPAHTPQPTEHISVGRGHTQPSSPPISSPRSPQPPKSEEKKPQGSPIEREIVGRRR